MLKRLSAVQKSFALSQQMQKTFSGQKIIYTETDEAPNLATYSLLPIIQRFAIPSGIEVEKRDISVAGRILSNFPDYLTPEQRTPDELHNLGEICKTPDANIIKLPNVSASVPQLKAAISELQSKGYKIPDYNPNPKTESEIEIKNRYAKVLGSAVNPVLREGNSDRRCAEPVKKHAQSIKKRSPALQQWAKDNRSRISSMKGGDFFGNEQSQIMKAGTLTVTLKQNDGQSVILKQNLKVQDGEVIDATFLDVQALNEFFESELTQCKKDNILVSLHMKATMMKVSDPIIFGHCVKVYYKDVFQKYGTLFEELGVNVNNGLGDLYDKIKGHPKQKEIEAAIQQVYTTRPGLAMVNSSKGITNLHVPSDIIIDASMPNVVRDGGQMWNKDDKLQEVVCMVPDRSYATIYQAIIEDCQKNGQFDYTTMGHSANVGLMAQKAEEYGSHDKTFEIQAPGTVVVTDQSGKEIFSHKVNKGDIYRMCQAKALPIQDWVKLAVTRAKDSGSKAIFWLDPARAHDKNLIDLAKTHLKELDTKGLDIEFRTPEEAMKETVRRIRLGQDTISCTGNVLRDYLTDLFPILELGTSAKMLSIVPLLAGGCLLETGAGGSAPKHVEQLLQENHLRWDSLGEYLATSIGFTELGKRANNPKAALLGDTLMEAIGTWLQNDKVPGRKAKQIDNRGSSYYIALYWAQSMAKKDSTWQPLADQLQKNEEQIVKELIECQGKPVDIGGYYKLDAQKANSVMRPSQIFNDIIDKY